MINLKPVNITATTIEDAWFQTISAIFDKGFHYVIEHGSFVGQTRYELDFATIYIKNPYQVTSDGSYDAMIPKMPEGSNIVPPVDNGYIEQYIPYLMTGNIDSKEQYTYGSRINEHYYIPKDDIVEMSLNQYEHFINLLKKFPGTNQAILQVGSPEDMLLQDPPCLRHIDMRVKYNDVDKKHYLVYYPYFRSWDLWGGFPANLGGIAVMQKCMADEIGVESGPMICSSKAVHIYGYVEDLAKIRRGL